MQGVVAIGRSGPVEVWDTKRAFPRMPGDIRKFATGGG